MPMAPLWIMRDRNGTKKWTEVFPYVWVAEAFFYFKISDIIECFCDKQKTKHELRTVQLITKSHDSSLSQSYQQLNLSYFCFHRETK